ncbi:MAG TPA: hypothetical protein VFV81_08300 [Verrucomicrobiae bacterium]|nr:hypothetical protein [Verrucomicrobiae bacterium]
MNKVHRPLICLIAWLAVVLPALNLSAQTASPEPRYNNRLLLVFDTSSAMKARVDHTEGAVNELLTTMVMGASLRVNDSIGVWTMGKEVSFGKFPLQTWKSDQAAGIASNINQFVEIQRYESSTRFDTLPALLRNVVEVSDRLTIAVFCDGDGKIEGTPYDAGINGAFQQYRSESRKLKQPIVIILRSQLGRYCGCQVYVAPEIVIPDFPPFPPPPKPLLEPKAATNPAPVAPAAQYAPPFVMVGTNVYTGPNALTNLGRPAPPPAAPVVTNKPPAVGPLTDAASVSETVTAKPPAVATTVVTQAAPEPEVVVTNVVVSPVARPARGIGFAIFGVVCLIAAVCVVLFARPGRSRPPGGQ